MKCLAPFLPVAMLATASFLQAQTPAEPATPAVPAESAPAAAAKDDDATYRTLTLASGLKVDLPKGWTVVRGSDSQPVEKVDVSFLKPQQAPQEGGLTTWLQTMSPAGIGHASLTIQSSSGPTSLGLQKGSQTLSDAELKKMHDAILHEEGHALGLREMQQLSELKPVELSSHHGVEYQYQLAALPGGEQDTVDEIRILSGDREVHFLFTRPAGDATQWQPVFDHIRGSIHFPAAGEGSEKKKKSH